VFGLFGYLSHRVSERRKDPELPGVMSRLLDRLSDAEAIGTIVVVAFGVLDPIAELTGLVLLALACDPQWGCAARRSRADQSSYHRVPSCPGITHRPSAATRPITMPS